MHPRLTTDLFSSHPAQWRRLRPLSLVCAAVLLLVAPGIAVAATPVPAQQSSDNAAGATVNVGDSSLGQILVDANGMTLYLFDNDEPGKSNCDAGCLRRWPPLLADAGVQPVAGSGVSATLGTIQRDDGTTQVTANDMPLYYWFEDKQPGDVLGQAVGDVWWVLAPDGTAIRTAAATGDTAATGDVTNTETLTDTTATTGTTDATDTTVTGADVITNTNTMTDTGASAAASTSNTGTGGTSDTGTAADTATTGTSGTTDTSSASGTNGTGDTSAAGTTGANDTSGASGTTSAGSTSAANDTSGAPQQMPVTGADGGTLNALLAVLGVAAGGGWVALRNRKR